MKPQLVKPNPKLKIYHVDVSEIAAQSSSEEENVFSTSPKTMEEFLKYNYDVETKNSSMEKKQS